MPSTPPPACAASRSWETRSDEWLGHRLRSGATRSGCPHSSTSYAQYKMKTHGSCRFAVRVFHHRSVDRLLHLPAQQVGGMVREQGQKVAQSFRAAITII